MDEYIEEIEDEIPEPRRYNCERYQECYTQAAKFDIDMNCGCCLFYAGQIISHPPSLPTFSDSDIRV